MAFGSRGLLLFCTSSISYQLLVNFQLQDGSSVVERPEDVELCHYQGSLRGVPSSWAAVSTCDGHVSGALFDGKQMHFVENDNNGTHFHYREEDRVQNDLRYTQQWMTMRFNTHMRLILNNICVRCGFSSHNDRVHNSTRVRRDIQNRDKDNVIDRRKGGKLNSVAAAAADGDDNASIKGPWNANSRSRYVELLLVVDHKEYLGHGEDLNKIYRICKVTTDNIHLWIIVSYVCLCFRRTWQT